MNEAGQGDAAESIWIGGKDKVSPGPDSVDSMWRIMEELFPLYRSLCGPGFHQSLRLLQNHLDLEITEFATGSEVLGWTIPPEFAVNEAWVENEAGERVIDFADHCYHVWIYSQSFDGVLSRDELIENIATLPEAPDLIPMRQTYYREKWGLCASQRFVDALPEGNYRVHIDTEHRQGYLRFGEYYLPGEREEEVLINTYLCHPAGANDNLSAVAVAVELFRLLSQLPNRRYSYRLVIGPETIGPITYIASYPDRMARTIGGYHVLICGDGAPVYYMQSYYGDSVFDRAAAHALKHCGFEDTVFPYSHVSGGSDSGQLNAVGVRKAVGCFTRSGPPVGFYREYHSSGDDLELVRPEYLRQTLEVMWYSLMAVERSVTYKGAYTVDPFLSKHGIFPYHHGAGEGRVGNQIAQAYYELMGGIDGRIDLLAIAERIGQPITTFDEAVSDFLRVGLMREVEPEN
jgi:aminopeptidase-like protein